MMRFSVSIRPIPLAFCLIPLCIIEFPVKKQIKYLYLEVTRLNVQTLQIEAVFSLYCPDLIGQACPVNTDNTTRRY